MQKMQKSGKGSEFDDIDSLPLAIKKFMKSEYLVFYEESKQNEAEVEMLKHTLINPNFFAPIVGREEDYPYDEDGLSDLDYEDMDEDEEYLNEMYNNDDLDNEYYDKIMEQINEDIQNEISRDIANGPSYKAKKTTFKANGAEKQSIEDEYLENDEDFVSDDDWEDEDDEEIEV